MQGPAVVVLVVVLVDVPVVDDVLVPVVELVLVPVVELVLVPVVELVLVLVVLVVDVLDVELVLDVDVDVVLVLDVLLVLVVVPQDVTETVSVEGTRPAKYASFSPHDLQSFGRLSPDSNVFVRFAVNVDTQSAGADSE